MLERGETPFGTAGVRGPAWPPSSQLMRALRREAIIRHQENEAEAPVQAGAIEPPPRMIPRDELLMRFGLDESDLARLAKRHPCKRDKPYEPPLASVA